MKPKETKRFEILYDRHLKKLKLQERKNFWSIGLESFSNTARRTPKWPGQINYRFFSKI